ncbi:MAG TPA: 16S rRNA (cytosine(1402)-N(4))-methyltransferase RsmH [Desulfobacterales bacterium]
MPSYHVPAMLQEVLRFLAPAPGKTMVDCTLGGSGHAAAICEQIQPDGVLIGIDQDAEAVSLGRKRLDFCRARVHLVHDNFAHLPQILSRLEIVGADGILADLGISLHQIEHSGRGFSFQRDEPLDMRMDPQAGEKAEDIINRAGEIELARIFREFGEERHAKSIARRVVAARKKAPIRTSRQLAELVRAAIPRGAGARMKIHPATRVFMALRIAVNHELERLDQFLDVVCDCLLPGGRLCVLAFHSLEDRRVKQCFARLAKGCICPPRIPRCVCGRQPTVRRLTRKVVRPSAAEVEANPAARSTRLRAVEKI